MKILIQRSLAASVTIAGDCVGKIDYGLVALLGFEPQDNDETLGKMADKLLAYRVFADEQGKMNLNVTQVGGGVLAVSQFTLAADTRKGLRPSFSSAAAPDHAQQLYDAFIDKLKARYALIECGRFGADMQVSLINDGPVTFLLE